MLLRVVDIETAGMDPDLKWNARRELDRRAKERA